MKKIYDIFVSDSIEVSVRKSAAEQLAQIMQGNSSLDGHVVNDLSFLAEFRL